MTRTPTPTALVTGGSSGLGLALVRTLDDLGWHVVTDARDPRRLARALGDSRVRAVPGDVADVTHRRDLLAEVDDGLDLLVLNASTLGPLPMRPLVDHDAADLAQVLATNVVAHAALLVGSATALRARDGVVVGLSSDAAVQHYETWGPYGASKAALDHVVLTFGAETGLASYAVDPGDMRTPMHQDAFPGEDIGDRPLPGTVVPRLLSLLEQRPPSGRYVAADLPAAQEVPA